MRKNKEHIYFAVCGNQPGESLIKFDGMTAAIRFARRMREAGYNSTPGVRTDKNGENVCWEPVTNF